jgi:hypothetical protein
LLETPEEDRTLASYFFRPFAWAGARSKRRVLTVEASRVATIDLRHFAVSHCLAKLDFWVIWIRHVDSIRGQAWLDWLGTLQP